MEFMIVTGMSGAGKSTALKILEDRGFFCVDNLPVKLINGFASLCMEDSKEQMEDVALGIDIRSGDALGDMKLELERIKKMGIECQVLFLNASNRILVKRYKETRRNHPLARDGRVEDGIEKERQIMDELKTDADYVLDTSRLLTRELKEELNRILFQGKLYGNFNITMVSFGFKYGIPEDVDLVFDVRFLPNPYYDLALRPLTGNDKKIRDFVFSSEGTGEFLKRLEEMLTFLIPYYIKEGKYNLVVGIGCTGGKHRSVAIVNELKEDLKNLPYMVRTEHRDIKR